MSELPKTYNPQETEERIYKLWEESGYFNPDNLPGERKEEYTVMIAPPNITGSLHMGHALENTISDIMVRYKRMRGFKTLWLPGIDHAGISAQSKVEKELLKQGFKIQDLGREAFIKKVGAWKEQYGSTILDQLKKLGFSFDWSRIAYTMDSDYQNAVKNVFNYYKGKGLIYKGKRIINWSVKDQTALSDLEIYYQEQKDTLWYLKYPLTDDANRYVIIATTRPETMLGDTAVAVHPSDIRYEDLIGKKIRLPITGREIVIIADHAVEKEFGTGAVKVTPAHDFLDFEIGQRHNLEQIEVINKFGKVTDAFPDFTGLKVTEAREAVAKKLQELGVIEKMTDYTHNVAYGERCQTIIEPLLSEQWFLKMDELAKKAVQAIESGTVTYHPERWKDVALTWLRNIRDWNISRQIWWGHPIPVAGETDVLDTWFSSALWPLATQGWQKPGDKVAKYPTQMITSARDILHLWITRMIFSGIEFMGEVPFKDVIIHGTILTKDGKRMSKSLGTGIDPLELIAKYGADATRFGLIYQSVGGQQDIKYGEEFILTGKKFANKLWNIARYILQKTGDNWSTHIRDIKKPFHIDEITGSVSYGGPLRTLSEHTTANLGKYQFGEALHEIYDVIWHGFADKYIEESKSKDNSETKSNLAHSLVVILKLLHPFMPFVTEEIWQQLPSWPGKKMLIVEEWPQ